MATTYACLYNVAVKHKLTESEKGKYSVCLINNSRTNYHIVTKNDRICVPANQNDWCKNMP